MPCARSLTLTLTLLCGELRGMTGGVCLPWTCKNPLWRPLGAPSGRRPSTEGAGATCVRTKAVVVRVPSFGVERLPAGDAIPPTARLLRSLPCAIPAIKLPSCSLAEAFFRVPSCCRVDGSTAQVSACVRARSRSPLSAPSRPRVRLRRAQV